MGLWYPHWSHFNLIGYSDGDYTSDKCDRKSMSRACQMLG